MKRIGIVALVVIVVGVVAAFLLRNGEEVVAPVYRTVAVTPRSRLDRTGAAEQQTYHGHTGEALR